MDSMQQKFRAWRASPPVQAWLQQGRRDPLGRFSGLGILFVTFWWQIAAWSRPEKDIIDRAIAPSIGIWTVRGVLAVLFIGLIIGKFWCRADIARVFSYASAVWWFAMLATVFINQWNSAAVGSYGLTFGVAAAYGFRVNRRMHDQACRVDKDGHC